MTLVSGKRAILFMFFFAFLLLQLIAGKFLAVETVIVATFLAFNIPDWHFSFNAESMGQNGRTLVEERYDEVNIIAKYEALIIETLKGRF